MLISTAPGRCVILLFTSQRVCRQLRWRMFLKLLKELHRILVIRTDRIGDVVLTTPVFKALRKAYPNAFISVLVSPLTQDLVKGNPYVDEVMIDDRKGINHGFLGALRLARLPVLLLLSAAPIVPELDESALAVQLEGGMLEHEFIAS